MLCCSVDGSIVIFGIELDVTFAIDDGSLKLNGDKTRMRQTTISTDFFIYPPN